MPPFHKALTFRISPPLSTLTSTYRSTSNTPRQSTVQGRYREIYLYYYFLLLVGYLFCFSIHALAAPSPNSSGLGEGSLNARGNPYDSAYNDEKHPGNDTSISRNTRRQSERSRGTLKCNDLKTHYVLHHHLVVAIENFCNILVDERGLVNNGPYRFGRVYWSDTKEEVKLLLEFNSDVGWIERFHCKRIFTDVLDDCSLPDPKTNPHNVKAGGVWTYTRPGAGTIYTIEPRMERATPDKAITAKCHCSKGVCDIAGHGWATADNGREYKDELEGVCKMKDGYVSTWDVLDKLEDGYEWKAKMGVESSQKDCVQEVLRRKGGPDSLVCTGE